MGGRHLWPYFYCNMPNLLENLLFPSVHHEIPTVHRPQEIVNRLAAGIRAPTEGYFTKPFVGGFDGLEFHFQDNRHWSWKVLTRGIVHPETNSLEVECAFDRWALVRVLMIIVGVSAYSVLQDSRWGSLSPILSAVICPGLLLTYIATAQLSLRQCAQEHLDFIRQALDPETGFDLTKYRHSKWRNIAVKTVWVIVGTLAVIIAFMRYVS